MGVEPCGGSLVRDLSSSLKPFVEIAREIDRHALRLLLLDEPTAALSGTDAKRLLEILRDIAGGGVAVVYVSHRLEEITAVADRVTVLSDGRVAGRFRRPEYDPGTIAECMTGRSILKVRKPEQQNDRRVLLRIEDLHVKLPGEILSGANLDILRGEILGIAGLSGHGKLAFGPGIMGIVPTSGRVFLEGTLLEERTPANMLARGICCLPDDRNHAGLLLDHSIEENIVFTALHSRGNFLRTPRLSGLSLLDGDSARTYAERCVERFRIKCRSVRQKVRELSGGNRQKVCLARILAVNPEILLVAEPTRGVDIEAREILLRMFLDLNRQSGTTILIASSDLDELKRVCDRIAVVCRGRVSDILGAPGRRPAVPGGFFREDAGAAMRGIRAPQRFILGFLAVMLGAVFLRGIPLGTILGDSMVRLVMNGVLVLSLMPMLNAGIGINYGLPVGVCAGLLGLCMAVNFRLAGLWGFACALIFSAARGRDLRFLLRKNPRPGQRKGRGRRDLRGLLLRFDHELLLGRGSVQEPGHALADRRAGHEALHRPEGLFCRGVEQLVGRSCGRYFDPCRPAPFFRAALRPDGLVFQDETRQGRSRQREKTRTSPSSPGVNVRRIRLTAVILSTILGAWGICVYAQSYGFIELYDAPLMMAFPAASAALVGGSLGRGTTVAQVFLGTYLFQTIYVLSGPLANELLVPEVAEIMRMLIANSIILWALIHEGRKTTVEVD